MLTIDVDDQNTWPAPIATRARELAGRLRGTTSYTSELPIPDADEKEFRALAVGHLFLAYHCTRLLDHEVAAIRERGLLPLTEALVRKRVEEAFKHSCIAQAQRDQLLNANVFADGQEENRENRISLFLGQWPFHRVHVLGPLLVTWGGEGIYKSEIGTGLRRMLEKLGGPAIVTAELDLSDPALYIGPALGNVLVGQLLALEEAGATVTYRIPVPAERIIDVSRPGDELYDRFPDLPRD